MPESEERDHSVSRRQRWKDSEAGVVKSYQLWAVSDQLEQHRVECGLTLLASGADRTLVHLKSKGVFLQPDSVSCEA